MNITESDKKRFWDKVDKSGDCWEWRGALTNGTYGAFWADGNYIRAHRFSYSLVNGVIPEGLLICHHCDNPACVNPGHLFMGTQADNIQDSVAKGRWIDNRGTNNGMSKLIENDIHEIRRLYSLGVTQALLGKMWKVSRPLVGLIVNRKRWGHI